MSSFTKQIETDTGETAEHFVLTYFHWDWHSKELSAHMSLFKNKATFEAGKQPMKPRCVYIVIRGQEFMNLFNHTSMDDILIRIMEIAKAQPNRVISDYHTPHRKDPLIHAGTELHSQQQS